MLDVIDIRQDLHRDSGNGLIWTLTLVHSDPPFDTLGLAVHICDGGDCGEQNSARTMSSYPWPRAHLPLQSGQVSFEDYHPPSTLIHCYNWPHDFQESSPTPLLCRAVSPQVRWHQRESYVFLTVEVTDCQVGIINYDSSSSS